MHYLFALPRNISKDISSLIIISTRNSTIFSNILYILVVLI